MLYPLSYEGRPGKPTVAGQRSSAITFAKLST